ncbi:MAG: hypothetical protein FJ102_22440 [Deltaproteobacteria bacterium]|nr:hypothetical protein [Deltaproteobacteria bacterium]
MFDRYLRFLVAPAAALTLGVALASAGWIAAPLLLLPGAWLALALLVAGRAWWDDPATWPGRPVLRGCHPARCALLLEVRRGEEARARPILESLAARRLACTVFVEAGVDLGLAAEGHQRGELRDQPGEGPWRPLGRRPRVGAGMLAGHTIVLDHASPDSRAHRVVGTDLVVVSPRVDVTRLLAWIDEWESRAVFAGTLSAALESG